MGMFDKAKEMMGQAKGAADKAKDLAAKVPGGEGIAEKIDEVTNMVPGMADAEAPEAEAPEAE